MQGLAIDAGGIAIFGFLLKRDLDAREKQIARMTREEDLGGLQIELANKKTLRLAQLRQFARIVSFCRFVRSMCVCVYYTLSLQQFHSLPAAASARSMITATPSAESAPMSSMHKATCAPT